MSSAAVQPGNQKPALEQPLSVRVTELPAQHTAVSGWEKAYVVLTAILALVGFGGVVIAVRTLGTIERQTVLAGTAAEAALKNAIAAFDGAQAAEKNAEAARDSAMTARISADALINSERAWVLAELGWYEGGLHTAHTTGSSGDMTSVNVKLTCRNEGRSPAWIDQVLAIAHLANSPTMLQELPDDMSLGNYSPMDAIGAGSEKSRGLELHCDGKPGTGEFIAVYVVIKYRDIFGLSRATTLGYSVHGPILYRQDAIRERNVNT